MNISIRVLGAHVSSPRCWPIRKLAHLKSCGRGDIARDSKVVIFLQSSWLIVSEPSEKQAFHFIE